MTFLLETLRLGLVNLRLHLLRSILTALGIILGIAAVIIMTAVAEGANRAALRQFEILGARNIILRSVRPAASDSMSGGQSGNTSWITAYGLTRQDVRRVSHLFRDMDAVGVRAEHIVPLKLVGADVTRGARRMTSQAYGTTPELVECAALRIDSGRYLAPADVENHANICVIGHEVARQLFRIEDPIGETLRIDDVSFEVVGVLEPVGLAGGTGAALVGRDLNRDIHIPFSTAEVAFGDVIMRRGAGTRDNTEVEVSEVYLAMPTTEDVLIGAELADRTLRVDDSERRDAQVIVPYELLESARRTARTWKQVMVIIAAIALLVGGIGIMNIMLASVTERTREIGVRRALGATRRHIIWQFLVETGVLSMLGGLLGIVIGVGSAIALGAAMPDAFPTHITTWSIIVSFIVACGVGLVFGLYPASVAARQDPIVALRHD